MSLINKMLQDLDARGGQPGNHAQLHVQPVMGGERRAPVVLIAVGALVIAALGAAAYFGWRYVSKPKPAPAKAVIVQAPQPVAPLPVATPVSPPVASAPAVAVASAPPSAALPAPEAEPAPVAAPKPHKKAIAKVKGKAKARKSGVATRRGDAKKVAPVAKPQPAEGREMTPQQRAESEYRRANAALQDGRVSDAIAALGQVLQLDPHHEAARQTLIGLLVEARRNDEAMRQLQTALTLDARQPAMAMLLARLQIERGGNGIDTLMRTLPYASGNGEYHAFLAGALQRAQRQREAIEQYQAALRTTPSNGVWWMGLGISLQAEKRNAEARDAFEHARASGTLSAELQAFVERKLQQLAR